MATSFLILPMVVGVQGAVAGAPTPPATPLPVASKGQTVGEHDPVVARPLTGAVSQNSLDKQKLALAHFQKVTAPTPSASGRLSTSSAAATSATLAVSYQMQTQPSWCGPTTLSVIASYKAVGFTAGTVAGNQSQAANLLNVSATGDGTPFTGNTTKIPAFDASFPVAGYPIMDALNYQLATQSAQHPSPGSSANPAEIVRAIDQQTGQEQPPPAGVTAGADHAARLITNGDLLAWNTSTGGLRMWDPRTTQSTNVIPPFDRRAPGLAQMSAPHQPAFIGPFLTWNSTQTYVLDTRTFSYVALTTNTGDAAAGGNYLGFWEYPTATAPHPDELLNYVQRLLDLSKLPRLPPCK